MRFFLFFCLLFSPNLLAQGVLVAWNLGQAPAVVELVATNNLPVKQIVGELLPSLPAADFELYLYQVPDRQQRLTLMRELRANKNVKFIELDSEVLIQTNPLLPSHFKQLNLVNASEQPIQYPCESYPIAIIDTGINTFHPSLASVNFNFQKNYLYQQSTSAEDDNGHGTHVAGLIAALPTQVTDKAGKKLATVAGICSSANLHNMKALPKDSGGNISHIYAAFKDALDKGSSEFPIINASIQTSSGMTLQSILTKLSEQGHFIIAAAGNGGNLIDINPSYPAAFSNSLELVISVGNVQLDNKLAQTSNYGYQLVDLAAPGEKLLSTWINNSSSEAIFEYSSGTSMSTPLVAATLAALMQKYQSYNLPPAAFRAALMNSLTHYSALQGKLRYPGVLNTGSALEANFEELFKATWFNFEWVEGVNALYLKGYLLDQVDMVVFKNKTNSFSQNLDFSYSTSKQGLLVSLPEDWQSGYLELSANKQRLTNLDFTLMASKALPSNTVCKNDICSLSFDNYQVQVTRLDGNQNTSWILTSGFEGEDEVLIITGTDLSANWQFHFSGQPRLRLVTLQADIKGQGIKTLTAADGFYINENFSTANWYLDKPANWSNLPAPLQQLVLKAQVATQVELSSSNHCYIATSVYGDTNAPEVLALREFRDKFLMRFYLGQKFVDFYYAYSPSLVEWMEDKPRLQSLVRWWLNLLLAFLR